jgi:hypothetical protein
LSPIKGFNQGLGLKWVKLILLGAYLVKNKVWEPNLGLIEKIKILRDQI